MEPASSATSICARYSSGKMLHWDNACTMGWPFFIEASTGWQAFIKASLEVISMLSLIAFLVDIGELRVRPRPMENFPNALSLR